MSFSCSSVEFPVCDSLLSAHLMKHEENLMDVMKEVSLSLLNLNLSLSDLLICCREHWLESINPSIKVRNNIISSDDVMELKRVRKGQPE